jgi:hypothetical protein
MSNKVKKRITPQLIAPPPPPPPKQAAKKHAGGHRRLENASNGTLKQMKVAIKAHNERYCIKLTGTKAAVKSRVDRAAKRFRDIERRNGGEKPQQAARKPGSGGATEGQKTTARRLRELEKRVRRAGDKDMASELAF